MFRGVLLSVHSLWSKAMPSRCFVSKGQCATNICYMPKVIYQTREWELHPHGLVLRSSDWGGGYVVCSGCCIYLQKETKDQCLFSRPDPPEEGGAARLPGSVRGRSSVL